MGEAAGAAGSAGHRWGSAPIWRVCDHWDICGGGLPVDVQLRASRQLGKEWGPGCWAPGPAMGTPSSGHLPVLGVAGNSQGLPRPGGPGAWPPASTAQSRDRRGEGARRGGSKRGFEYSALGWAWEAEVPRCALGHRINPLKCFLHYGVCGEGGKNAPLSTSGTK